MRSEQETINELRQVSLFAGLPEEQLQWLVDQGVELRLEPGDLLLRQGEFPEYFYVMLAGEVRFVVASGAGENVFRSYGPGEFFAEDPFLLGTPSRGTGHALTESRLFGLRPDDFWQMLRSIPEATRAIMEAMAERFFSYQGMLSQQEKLTALGRIAAGLSHELNNPAAAGSRAVRDLRETVETLEDLAPELGNSGLSGDQYEILARLREATGNTDTTPPDPLEQGELEDELALWMEDRGVEDAWELAPAFVVAGLDAKWLEGVTGSVPKESLETVLRYLDAVLRAEALLGELEESTARISALVGAVRSYSQMDRAPEGDVDVHEGLESTLAVLGHRLADVEVAREYDPELPFINARGSELNLVWSNLIYNALDAMDGAGRLTIHTARKGDRILVEVSDTGSGIPEELKNRVWEPFFTTKDVGGGTGLGLDIVRRIVCDTHGGDVDVESRPGDTRFRVRLPVG